jgi:hypothetical protein
MLYILSSISNVKRTTKKMLVASVIPVKSIRGKKKKIYVSSRW